ncbi:glucosamine-6-phosphate deaminase [Acrasis kona]|uniref:Glucosamine-6-phosphate deaminase n=1 Tax=Acrasis kona TaxID=1008807 RepID=A0AAW2Z8T2_9EUKA
MNIIVEESPQQVAREAAKRVARVIRTKQEEGTCATLCLPTGSTPILMYRELIRMHKEEGLSFKDVHTFNLDEYYPMQPTSEHSYHTFMHKEFFDHVDVAPENIHIPDGTLPAESYLEYCNNYEQLISNNGIDIAILGIGGNGHIGFNEPGSQRTDRTRIVVLNQTTRSDAAKSFGGSERNVPTRAVTMGVASIMSAKKVLLLATGEGKANIVHKALEDPKVMKDKSTCPASFLRGHESFTAIVDKAAGALLKQTQSPWLLSNCGNIDWNDDLRKRALIHLSKHLKKGICELTHSDLDKNGLTSLLLHILNRSNQGVTLESECLATLNDLLSRIAVLPNHAKIPSDLDERVLIFSPHPDDDVISMGGIMYHMAQQRLLKVNNDPSADLNMKVCYMTNGSVAVDNAVLRDHLRFAKFSAQLIGADDSNWKNQLQLLNEKNNSQNTVMQYLKANVRKAEAMEAVQVLGLDGDRDCIFLDLPFYRTGQEKKKPLGPDDVDLVKKLFLEQKPKHIFVAADLTDPHGTHRVCYDAIYQALAELRQEGVNEFQDQNVHVWLYRGAWQEFDIHESSIFVPMSLREMDVKIQSIFKHQSQKDAPLFPGNDSREFWQRARDRNRNTATELAVLGLPKFYAAEAFVVCRPSEIPK